MCWWDVSSYIRCCKKDWLGAPWCPCCLFKPHVSCSLLIWHCIVAIMFSSCSTLERISLPSASWAACMAPFFVLKYISCSLRTDCCRYVTSSLTLLREGLWDGEGGAGRFVPHRGKGEGEQKPLELLPLVWEEDTAPGILFMEGLLAPGPLITSKNFCSSSDKVTGVFPVLFASTLANRRLPLLLKAFLTCSSVCSFKCGYSSYRQT